MKCLAATQGPKVRINAVLPGLLLTEWVNLEVQQEHQEIANKSEGAGFGPERIKAIQNKAVLKKEVKRTLKNSLQLH